MNRDELFQSLEREHSQSTETRLISQALEDGISLDEIRDMLDYLENSRRQSQKNASSHMKKRRRCWLDWFPRRISKA